MKKKILICHWNMVIGGIESALINLLNRIDSNQFEVDLLLEDKMGELLQFIPSYVNVIDSASIGLITGGTKRAFFYELKHFRIISALKVLYYWYRKDMRRFDCFYEKAERKQYDVAISYSTHSIGLTMFVNNYIDANVKMVFMHNKPVKRVHKPGTIFMDDRIKCITNYNYICCVSDSIKDEFIELFPQYKNKCLTIYNFIDQTKINKLSLQNIKYDMQTDSIKILSVGRITSEKNFTIIPAVCNELIKNGIDFKWYIVGDGDEREVVIKAIIEMGLQDKLILLGSKTNPYPYFKATDIYCQTSLTEAYCMTVCEARILNKPIVSTEFCGIREQLSNGRGGIIVETTPEAIAEGIIKIIKMDKDKKEEMLAIAAYPNELEMATANKFFEIIGQRQ
jgi:glycosyltransferase involved in cell wall biosynthesis